MKNERSSQPTPAPNDANAPRDGSGARAKRPEEEAPKMAEEPSGARPRGRSGEASSWAAATLQTPDPSLTPATREAMWRGIEGRARNERVRRALTTAALFAAAIGGGLLLARYTRGEGHASRCAGAIACQDGSYRVRALEPGSSLDAAAGAEGHETLRLHGGRVYVEVERRSGPLRLQVGDTTLRSTGGRFEVAREGEAHGAGVRVRVDEGTVSVTHSGAEVTLQGGAGSRRFGGTGGT